MDLNKTDWNAEDRYWRDAYSGRPYATGGRSYDYYQPGYRYGYESASQHSGKRWEDVESDLKSGWDKYEHRGKSTWEEMKEAVRDAWNRMTGVFSGEEHHTTHR